MSEQIKQLQQSISAQNAPCIAADDLPLMNPDIDLDHQLGNGVGRLHEEESV